MRCSLAMPWPAPITRFRAPTTAGKQLLTRLIASSARPTAVNALKPVLLAQLGIGPVSAAQVLISW